MNRKKLLIFTIVFIVFVFALILFSLDENETISQPDYNQGDFYSVVLKDEVRVVKIVMPWDDIVMVSLYKNKFEERPESIKEESLFLYEDEVKEARLGREELPVKLDEFESWKPEFIASSGEIKYEEYFGFDHWKESPERWYFPDDYPNADKY